MSEALIASIGSGSNQSSSKSTSAPCAAAAIFIWVFVSLTQARYSMNNSSRVRDSSSWYMFGQAPIFTNISDSYLKRGISSQARASPLPPSLVRKGLNPLRQPSTHQSNASQVRPQVRQGLLPIRDQLRSEQSMRLQP